MLWREKTDQEKYKQSVISQQSKDYGVLIMYLHISTKGHETASQGVHIVNYLHGTPRISIQIDGISAKLRLVKENEDKEICSMHPIYV